jgi:hypothetical protein
MSARELLIGLAGIFVGGATTIATGTYDYWTKGRELDIRMINVALTILSGENDDTKSLPARKFALDTLNKYSGIKIAESDYQAWLRAGTLPAGKFPVSWDYFVTYTPGPLGSAPLGGGPIGGGGTPPAQQPSSSPP